MVILKSTLNSEKSINTKHRIAVNMGTTCF
jgi:hypothetical protein